MQRVEFSFLEKKESKEGTLIFWRVGMSKALHMYCLGGELSGGFEESLGYACPWGQ